MNLIDRLTTRVRHVARFGAPVAGRPRLARNFEAKEQRLLHLLLDNPQIINGGRDHSEVLREIREDICSGPPWFDPMARAESLHPLYFCISYPRSGSLRFISAMQKKLGADRFWAMPHEARYLFDKRWQTRAYPRPRLVKDHRPLKRYLHDDGFLLIRDGRDTMVSLAWMTYARGRHKFFKREELTDFIRWTASHDYRAFGSWANHTRRMLDLKKGGHKELIRYEDKPVDTKAIASTVAQRQSGRAWGVADESLAGSMFEAWQKNRGKSNWRDSFDRPAALAFHETGATEMLMELGYETDPEWWKQL